MTHYTSCTSLDIGCINDFLSLPASGLGFAPIDDDVSGSSNGNDCRENNHWPFNLLHIRRYAGVFWVSFSFFVMC